jgi:hypothetical protein
VSHKNYCRDLLDQGTIDCIGPGQLLFLIVIWVIFIKFIRRIGATGLVIGVAEKYGGKIDE